jgi:hypothetical protein
MTDIANSKITNNNSTRNNTMQSDSIAALAAALSKAQADITGALKDSSNPFFKSKYADLASCWDACRKQLSANGLAVIQTTDIIADNLVLITTLAHSSGEWVKSITPILMKDHSPQAQGSGITYARRYALAAIVGLAQIDDDAEAAQARGREVRPDPKVIEQIASCSSTEGLTKLFKSLPTEARVTHMEAFSSRKKELEAA